MLGDVPYAVNHHGEVTIEYDLFTKSVSTELERHFRGNDSQDKVSKGFDMAAVDRLWTYFVRDFPDRGLPPKIVFTTNNQPYVPWMGGVRMLRDRIARVPSPLTSQMPEVTFKTPDGRPWVPIESEENRRWWQQYARR